jgi:hypothetical protein
VTEEAIKTWRKQGAPIKGKSDNDRAAIGAWRKSRRMDRSGLSAQTRNHYLRATLPHLDSKRLHALGSGRQGRCNRIPARANGTAGNRRKKRLQCQLS